jgi:putative Holliday junction resolvase
MGLDPGSVRIGVALSDPLGMTAQPLQVLERTGPRKDLRRLSELAREQGVSTIVVGLPRKLSGEEGRSAAQARELAEALGRRLPGVRIALWDERLTTVEVTRTMSDGKVSRSRKKQVVDVLAAVLILQGYLDAGCP